MKNAKIWIIIIFYALMQILRSYFYCLKKQKKKMTERLEKKNVVCKIFSLNNDKGWEKSYLIKI